jgi:uncharacterized protein YdbL (DUF1318 family)
MRYFLILAVAMGFGLGCARVQVGGTKEPIKMDISMRVDIYQHVEKDIDAIENLVSGPQGNKKVPDRRGMLGIFVAEAYAQEGLSPEVEQAAMRRKERLSQVSSLESQGVIGENKNALVELRNPEVADASVTELISAENSDRMVIYQAVAKKNGTSMAEVQKLYAKRLQSSAPAGSQIEEADGWKVK